LQHVQIALEQLAKQKVQEEEQLSKGG